MFYLTTHSTHFSLKKEGRKCFILNTFYLQLYGVRHMVKDHSDSEKEGRVLFNDTLNTFYLRLYGVGHMIKDHLVREEIHCCHMGYTFQLAARVILYASSHRQNNTYHSLYYISHGALAGARYGSTLKDPSDRTMNERSYQGPTSRSCYK